MKFKLDNKTGIFMPQKNETIYFNKSQGGGMIVDDKKHNVRFILERNGNVTILFGNIKNLNIYDRRDASLIVERVKRILGMESRFNDIKCFLIGFNEGSFKNTVVECDCAGCDCGGVVPTSTGNGDGMGAIVFPTNGDNGFSGIRNGSGDMPTGLYKTRKNKSKKKIKNDIKDMIVYKQPSVYIKTYEQFLDELK